MYRSRQQSRAYVPSPATLIFRLKSKKKTFRHKKRHSRTARRWTEGPLTPMAPRTASFYLIRVLGRPCLACQRYRQRYKVPSAVKGRVNLTPSPAEARRPWPPPQPAAPWGAARCWAREERFFSSVAARRSLAGQRGAGLLYGRRFDLPVRALRLRGGVGGRGRCLSGEKPRRRHRRERGVRCRRRSRSWAATRTATPGTCLATRTWGRGGGEDDGGARGGGAVRRERAGPRAGGGRERWGEGDRRPPGSAVRGPPGPPPPSGVPPPEVPIRPRRDEGASWAGEGAGGEGGEEGVSPPAPARWLPLEAGGRPRWEKPAWVWGWDTRCSSTWVRENLRPRLSKSASKCQTFFFLFFFFPLMQNSKIFHLFCSFVSCIFTVTFQSNLQLKFICAAFWMRSRG